MSPRSYPAEFQGLTWRRAPRRCGRPRAARVVRSMSRRREKKPSSTSRSEAESLASAGAGRTTRRCGGPLHGQEWCDIPVAASVDSAARRRSKRAVAALVPVRLIDLAVADHQRPGNHVAQPLMPLAHEHGDDAHGVKTGQIVDKAHQVARQRLDKADAAAGLMDHANLCHALARRAPVVEGLKEREIAPLQQEDDRERRCRRPSWPRLRRRNAAREE